VQNDNDCSDDDDASDDDIDDTMVCYVLHILFPKLCSIVLFFSLLDFWIVEWPYILS